MAAAAALSLPTPPTAAATDAVTDKAGASTSTAELLDAHDTTLTACALEMCSWPPPSRDEKSSSGCCWVVCGTYQLVKAAEAGGEDRREGSLLLYQLGGGEGQKRKRRLTPRQAVALKEEGVLDCKWSLSSSSTSTRPLLACATSKGRITTYVLQPTADDGEGEEGQSQLVPGPATRPLSAGDDAPASYMALALEWARTPPGAAVVVASSNNDGTVCVHELRDEGAELVEVAGWDAHSLYGSPIEVWTTAFADPHRGSLLLTGGDDCALKMWDLRCLDQHPVWSDTRSHGAGVTSLQACFGEEEEGETWCFASGSYDGVLRLWDRRKMGRPVISHQTDVGGGIWRIKWGKPARRRLLALACMHEGAAVLRLPEKGGEEHGVEMVTRYKGHESMAYGIDWCQQDEEEEEAVLASCSFYDHAAHLWSVKTDG